MGGKKWSVRGLVYTARVLVAPHILSIYEELEGNSQKLEENGRKKVSKKKESKKERRKEKERKIERKKKKVSGKERKKERRKQLAEASVSAKASYTCVCVCVCVCIEYRTRSETLIFLAVARNDTYFCLTLCSFLCYLISGWPMLRLYNL